MRMFTHINLTDSTYTLTPQLVLSAYNAGLFPMADNKDHPNVYWVEPKERGVIKLDEFHVPKRLNRFINNSLYATHINRDFARVIKECGSRHETWINKDIERVFNELHTLGHAHSVEIYDENDALIGGLYGLSIGGCFCGESMFSRADNASKMALVALAERCKNRKYSMIDTQFITDHLAQFGTKTMPQGDYLRLFESVRTLPISFI